MEKTSRFMASHIILVNIPPEQPIRAPTEVNNGLDNNQPSQAKAQPE